MNVTEIVKNAIRNQCIDIEKTITLGARLREDLLLDSLDLTEIALMIEEDLIIEKGLRIILPDKALSTCETVGHLCNLVQNHLPKEITCE